MVFKNPFLLTIFSSLLLIIAVQNVMGEDNRFSAPLSGMEEVPPVNTNSTGIALFEFLNENEVSFMVNVTNMDNIKAAHIHMGEFGQNGDVISTLFNSSNGPTGIINGTLAEGKITAGDLQGPLKGKTLFDLFKFMNNTQTYVNIHSVEYPKGEIRGQITTVNATNWWNQNSLQTVQSSTFSNLGDKKTLENNQNQLRIGLHQPIIGYLTKAGGMFPMFNHIMFDSASMQKLIFMLNNPPVIEQINNATFKKFIDTAIDNNFFVIESPPPAFCPDCVTYILTLSIPFPSGTETNTVAFNSLFNFENPNDAETMKTLLDLIENLEESNYSLQQQQQ